jgi:hypothetical protein
MGAGQRRFASALELAFFGSVVIEGTIVDGREKN